MLVGLALALEIRHVVNRRDTATSCLRAPTATTAELREMQQDGPVTQNVITVLAVLGIVGQLSVGLLLLAGLLRLVGVHGPLASIRAAIWGYELWLAFLVSALATGGSLFLSEVANFVPCELCWFQRVFMYPLAITTLLAALFNDHRVARYLLPLPVIGAGVSIYHLLVENGVVEQTQACQVSAPGGCATKWIDEFGYVTIPTLALTAFALTFAFLLFALLESPEKREQPPPGKTAELH